MRDRGGKRNWLDDAIREWNAELKAELLAEAELAVAD